MERFDDAALQERSVRALTVELDGEPIAIAGVLYTAPLQVFSIMDDKMRSFPVTIMKTAKRLRNILASYSQPLYALASDEEQNSDEFLQRVGFEFVGENEDGRFYQWQSR